ncbi:ribulose-phosphate 3-epimerase [Intestinimonas massiliensis (ex Afouda et al. 2020)]|uniref:ribulose-phosphate 3-epimerase n=1 Tax=Intestinimonas massiliensis (ex Afouda et al. 2020) TaxID=1673721 RepID=UPI00102FBCB1|nr:ribulose-phosphate 3-epimerase [Intestinimonas massiliensis (ex Afouda et al. 2020)]
MIYSSTLICGDLLHLARDAELLLSQGCSTFHIDLMDAHLVPNLCFNFDLIRALHTRYPCTIDAHLMMDNAETYLDRLAEAGADLATIHLQSVPDPGRALRRIRELGMKAGLALSPGESFELARPYGPELDLLLVMGVRPGFSGQSFQPGCLETIRAASAYRRASGQSWLISVDGGVDLHNGPLCAAQGADMLVMGAFTFYQGGLSAQRIQACRQVLDPA